MQWISWVDCLTGMPEVDGSYLTWDGKSVSVTLLFFGQWQANHFAKKSITHWSTMPVGPKK